MLRELACTTRSRRQRIKPLCSATPMPSMATNTTPTGAKLVKLLTASDSIRCMPVALARLMTCWVSWVIGCSTCKSITCSTQDAKIISPLSQINNSAGCGSLFPACSMAANNLSSLLLCCIEFARYFFRWAPIFFGAIFLGSLRWPGAFLGNKMLCLKAYNDRF